MSLISLTVPTTCTSPHEMRESNMMRTHRNIDVNHYALDNKGRAVCVTPYPNALEGTNENNKVPFRYVTQHYDILQLIAITFQSPRYLHIAVPTRLIRPQVHEGGQTVSKDMDGSQAVILLPPLMMMMVNCTLFFA